MEYFNILQSACKDVGIEFNEEKYKSFMIYKDLIKEWNQKINLTAITEDEAIVKKHFIDCIKIFKFEPLKSFKRVIDVGTGAGFPGLPIEIVDNQKDMVLLDSLNKRIKFLQEVANQIGLKNIETLHGRAEDYSQKEEYREKFDAAVSRAVANMSVLSELCLPYVRVGGYFIAMKGPNAEEEITEAKKAISVLGGEIQEIIKVNIEGSDLNHNLVIIKKIKNTPKKYPRKAGIVSKNPIK